MTNYNFFKFVRWYFKYISDLHYCKPNNGRLYISKKERPFCVAFSYICFLTIFILIPFNFDYIVPVSFCLILTGMILLLMSRFSLIYYFILYKKYIDRNKNLNSKIIYDECALFVINKDISAILSKNYKLHDVKRNILFVKYILIDKNGKIVKLKVKSNLIYLNKKKICNVPLKNKYELEALI
jgi:hypothetical protein